MMQYPEKQLLNLKKQTTDVWKGVELFQIESLTTHVHF